MSFQYFQSFRFCGSTIFWKFSSKLHFRSLNSSAVYLTLKPAHLVWFQLFLFLEVLVLQICCITFNRWLPCRQCIFKLRSKIARLTMPIGIYLFVVCMTVFKSLCRIDFCFILFLLLAVKITCMNFLRSRRKLSFIFGCAGV